MRYATATLLAALLLPYSSIEAQGPKTVTLPPALAAAHEKEAAGWVKGDAAAVGAAYAPDVVHNPFGFGDWVGRDALVRYMSIHLQGFKYSMVRHEPQELIALGDYMFERGTLALARRSPTDTADRAVTWRYAFLWKKMPDGTWLIHRAINNASATAQPTPPRGGAGMPLATRYPLPPR